MSGRKTINQTTPAIGAIKIQQSTYGLVLPIVWGRTRITGNLMWYGDFKAVPHTEVTQQGGKGGGAPRQTSTTYTYTASVAMLLCEGPIMEVRTCWRGKNIFGGTAYSGARQLAILNTFYDGGTILVGGAGWADVSVEVRADTGYQDDYKYVRGGSYEPLVRGVDYTASGGVYTLSGVAVGQSVRITYSFVTAASGSSVLSALGMDLRDGTPGQAPWSYLTTNHPSEALGYSGIAYLVAPNYTLDASAGVENHAFEITAALSYSDTVPDANPAAIAVDALSNPHYGSGFGLQNIAAVTDYANACAAQGIFLSPALTEQTSAASFIEALAALTNVGLVWSGNALKFVPYTDTPITGNGVTFTPNTAPIYDLTDDDFQPGDEAGPVKVTRGSVGDSFNSISLEFMDRANAYNLAIMAAQDQADIQENGLRQMSTVSAHWIVDANVANIVANLILQRSMFIRNTYEFKLNWTKIALEPMDLVTLTDPVLMTRQPVRILTMEEDDDGYLSFTAEDFPKGSASATLYPSAVGIGFAHNFNEAPGACLAPVIFEAPATLATQGGDLELWLACGGTAANYGGCEVWISLTGSNYQRAASLNGSSRYGVTTSALGAATAGAVTTETLGIQLAAGGQITSASAADMNALSTLCWVGDEFFSYENATLTGAGAYTIGNHLLRGAYLSPSTSHVGGVPFVRCDGTLAKMPLSPDYIGKTIYIKVLPFNRYGGGLGDLAAATAYTYTVTGVQANSPPPAPAGLALEGAFSIDTAKFKWNKTPNANRYNVQVLAGPGPTYTLVRELQVGDALRFDYSASDAKTDGGPWRSLRFRVQGINANGAVGAFAQLDVSNPQIGALVAPSLTAGVLSAQFGCNVPSDFDFKGIIVCASTVSGFTPGSGNIVANGASTSVPINALSDGAALVAGVTIYVRAAAYDTFDTSALVWTPQLACTPVATAQELQFGGENLAYNSGFERSTGGIADGYSVYNNGGSAEATTASIGSPGRSGVGSHQNISWINNHTEAKGITGQICKSGWLPNKKYTIGFYAKTTTLAGIVQMFLGWNINPVLTVTVANPNISTAWQRYAFTITWGASVEANGTGYISVGYGSGPGNVQFDDLMVVEGDALPGYSPSISETAAAAAAAATAAANAQGDATAALNYYANISNDGILSRDEKPDLIQRYNIIYNEASSISAQGVAVGATTESTNYDNAFHALVAYLPYGWDNTAVDTSIDRAVFNAKFTDYYLKRTAVLIAIDTKIKAAAAAAQGDASAAILRIGVISADGYLSRDEKPTVIQQWNAINNEVSALYYGAGNLGLLAEQTNYYAPYQALYDYLTTVIPSWGDTSVDTVINRTVFNQKFNDYYTGKSALSVATDAKAATLSTWAGTGGAGKPQDNATVGAPAGTLVGSTDAATVEANAAAGAGVANAPAITIAQVTASPLAFSHSTGYVGTSVYNAVVSNGTAPFKYVWSVSGGEGSGAVMRLNGTTNSYVGPDVKCNVVANVDFYLTCTVIDAKNKSASMTFNLNVDFT